MRGPDEKLVRRSRSLRINQTRAESAFWHRVRNRQLGGCKFVRQEPIAGYICDLVCRDRMLIVEIDGGQHSESKSDAVRDRALRAEGYRIVRFWNHDVLQNIEGVLIALQSKLEEKSPEWSPSPRPSPRKSGERERAASCREPPIPESL